VSESKLERRVLLCDCRKAEGRQSRVILRSEGETYLGTCRRCGEAYELTIESFDIGRPLPGDQFV
jgi:hypothetical protein